MPTHTSRPTHSSQTATTFAAYDLIELVAQATAQLDVLGQHHLTSQLREAANALEVALGREPSPMHAVA